MRNYINILFSVMFISLNSQLFAQWTDNGNKLTTSDKVGIGTTGPRDKLHIYNSTNATATRAVSASLGTSTEFIVEGNDGGMELLGNNDQGSWASYLSFGNLNSAGNVVSKWGIIRQTNNLGDGSLRFTYGSSNEISLNSTLFSFNVDGSLGIGTIATGDHLLAVEGSIGTREVSVEVTSWPDFVFEKGYDLMPLDNLGDYITEYKHLPEIPSGPEIIRNGLDLGEMDAKLLQKIEELTLYLINQNERIKKQEVEISKLREEMLLMKQE